MKLFIAFILFLSAHGAFAASNCVNLNHVWHEDEYYKFVFMTEGCERIVKTTMKKDTNVETSRAYAAISEQWTVTERIYGYGEERQKERWYWDKSGTHLIHDKVREYHSDGSSARTPYLLDFSAQYEIYSIDRNEVLVQFIGIGHNDRNDGFSLNNGASESRYPLL